MFDQAPYDKFHEWPRHAQIVETQIAPRKRIEAGHFKQRLRADPHPNRARTFKFCFQFGEEFNQRVEAASEQNMNLAGLGCATTHDRLGRQGVTLKHSNGFKVRRQSLRSDETTNASSDHYRVSSE